METLVIVGAGRLGRALHRALGATGRAVHGPLRRGEPVPAGATAVLLCVPDAEIANAAATVPPGPLVGHCSGATTLDGLDFSLHPLMTVTERGADFAGATCAVAGHPIATELATALHMRPLTVADEDRAAYHAAASLASNYLVTLETAAERLFPGDRALLAPLVRATVANWEREGARALTGPIARGDEATVARQRAAVQERRPEDLPLWDALTEATRCL
jgi:predicted short-subunit dehydrogenase-like oxidoreductase (DUF2520 family)